MRRKLIKQSLFDSKGEPLKEKDLKQSTQFLLQKI
jgi:hypothetical protein